MNWQAVEAIGQIGGAIAAAAAIWWGLRGVRRQMWLSTFSDFTKRYADIIERFSSGVRVPGVFDVTGLPMEQGERVYAAFRQYFNLCSEEHYLAGIGIIDKGTWEIWTTGIRDSFRNSAFREGWKKLRVEYEYYPPFCVFMDAIVSQRGRPISH